MYPLAERDAGTWKNTLQKIEIIEILFDYCTYELHLATPRGWLERKTNKKPLSLERCTVFPLFQSFGGGKLT